MYKPKQADHRTAPFRAMAIFLTGVWLGLVLVACVAARMLGVGL